MKDPHIGSMEMGEDSVIHPGYPHLEVSLPITPGTAYPQGTVLQIDGATHALEAGDLTSRSYIATQGVGAADTDALVVALGAVRLEKLLHANGTALTSVEALTLMEKSPLAVI